MRDSQHFIGLHKMVVMNYLSSSLKKELIFSVKQTLINEHNFDVNMTDSEGLTALHFSA